MMKLRINPIVSEDLKKMKEYIAEDNEEMAVKTIQEIYARFENIQQFPYMGADLAKRVSFHIHNHKPASAIFGQKHRFSNLAIF